MQFYERYVELCEQIGKKPSKVAEEIGICRATVTNWKKNNYTPRADMLSKIADYFDLSVSELLGEAKEKEPSEDDPLTDEVVKLIKSLSEESLVKLIDYARLLLSAEQSQ